MWSEQAWRGEGRVGARRPCAPLSSGATREGPLPAVRGRGAERGRRLHPLRALLKSMRPAGVLHPHLKRQMAGGLRGWGVRGACALCLGTYSVRPVRLSTGTPPQPDHPPLPRSSASRFLLLR